MYSCAYADKEVSPCKVSHSRWNHVARTQERINKSISTRILPLNNLLSTKITITLHQPLVWWGKSQKLNILHKGKREILQGRPLVIQRDCGFPAWSLCKKKEWSSESINWLCRPNVWNDQTLNPWCLVSHTRLFFCPCIWCIRKLWIYYAILA